jgi:DNA-binding GntR family transcriptional regulator
VAARDEAKASTLLSEHVLGSRARLHEALAARPSNAPAPAR